MDAPEVRITVPEHWRSALGEQRPAAIFLAETVSEQKIATIIDEIGSLDPNIPIVLLSDDDG